MAGRKKGSRGVRPHTTLQQCYRADIRSVSDVIHSLMQRVYEVTCELANERQGGDDERLMFSCVPSLSKLNEYVMLRSETAAGDGMNGHTDRTRTPADIATHRHTERGRERDEQTDGQTDGQTHGIDRCTVEVLCCGLDTQLAELTGDLCGRVNEYIPSLSSGACTIYL